MVGRRTKRAGVVSGPASVNEPRPSYREGHGLSDEDALLAMRVAAQDVIACALEARYRLLALGFSTAHELCRDLDQTAAAYTLAMYRIRAPERDERAT